jgi:Synergist-CTERM protein sorting domain-containing protein
LRGKKGLLVLAVLAAALVFAGAAVYAANPEEKTWKGPATGGVWDEATYWSGGTPLSGDVAVFDTDANVPISSATKTSRDVGGIDVSNNSKVTVTIASGQILNVSGDLGVTAGARGRVGNPVRSIVDPGSELKIDGPGLLQFSGYENVPVENPSFGNISFDVKDGGKLTLDTRVSFDNFTANIISKFGAGTLAFGPDASIIMMAGANDVDEPFNEAEAVVSFDVTDGTLQISSGTEYPDGLAVVLEASATKKLTFVADTPAGQIGDFKGVRVVASSDGKVATNAYINVPEGDGESWLNFVSGDGKVNFVKTGYGQIRLDGSTTVEGLDTAPWSQDINTTLTVKEGGFELNHLQPIREAGFNLDPITVSSLDLYIYDSGISDSTGQYYGIAINDGAQVFRSVTGDGHFHLGDDGVLGIAGWRDKNVKTSKFTGTIESWGSQSSSVNDNKIDMSVVIYGGIVDFTGSNNTYSGWTVLAPGSHLTLSEPANARNTSFLLSAHPLYPTPVLNLGNATFANDILFDGGPYAAQDFADNYTYINVADNLTATLTGKLQAMEAKSYLKEGEWRFVGLDESCAVFRKSGGGRLVLDPSDSTSYLKDKVTYSLDVTVEQGILALTDRAESDLDIDVDPASTFINYAADMEKAASLLLPHDKGVDGNVRLNSGSALWLTVDVENDVWDPDDTTASAPASATLYNASFDKGATINLIFAFDKDVPAGTDIAVLKYGNRSFSATTDKAPKFVPFVKNWSTKPFNHGPALIPLDGKLGASMLVVFSSDKTVQVDKPEITGVDGGEIGIDGNIIVNVVPGESKDITVTLASAYKTGFDTLDISRVAIVSDVAIDKTAGTVKFTVNPGADFEDDVSLTLNAETKGKMATVTVPAALAANITLTKTEPGPVPTPFDVKLGALDPVKVKQGTVNDFVIEVTGDNVADVEGAVVSITGDTGWIDAYEAGFAVKDGEIKFSGMPFGEGVQDGQKQTIIVSLPEYSDVDEAEYTIEASSLADTPYTLTASALGNGATFTVTAFYTDANSTPFEGLPITVTYKQLTTGSSFAAAATSEETETTNSNGEASFGPVEAGSYEISVATYEPPSDNTNWALTGINVDANGTAGSVVVHEDGTATFEPKVTPKTGGSSGGCDVGLGLLSLLLLAPLFLRKSR